MGAGGMLARDLVAEAPDRVDLLGESHAALDVTDGSAVTAAIVQARPEVIINCAAYTNVDGAESERERAFQVNGKASGIFGARHASL